MLVGVWIPNYLRSSLFVKLNSGLIGVELYNGRGSDANHHWTDQKVALFVVHLYHFNRLYPCASSTSANFQAPLSQTYYKLYRHKPASLRNNLIWVLKQKKTF